MTYHRHLHGHHLCHLDCHHQHHLDILLCCRHQLRIYEGWECDETAPCENHNNDDDHNEEYEDDCGDV